MIIPGLLAVVILVAQSFTYKPDDKNAARVSFFVDGAPLEGAAANNYRAELINGGKTVALTFIGSSVKANSGNVYPTKLTIEYAAKENTTGEVSVENVCYEYNNVKYYGLAGTAYVSITKLKRNTDGRSLLLNADVFCKVQPHFVMEEFVPVFSITGSVQNLKVDMPAS